MKRQRLHILIWITQAFAIPFAFSADHLIHTDVEMYINGIKKSSQIHEDFISKLSAEQSTILRLRKEKITLTEVIELYQSLSQFKISGGMITVMTIRNNHLSESDSTEKCIDNIITAAQNFIYENKSETFFKDLCITIEYIHHDHLPDYDALNDTFTQIEMIKSDLMLYVVDNFFEIICGSLRQHICPMLHDFVCDEFNEKYRAGVFDCSVIVATIEAEIEKHVDKVYKRIVYQVRTFTIYRLMDMIICEQPKTVYSVFEVLKSHVQEYERKKQINYFTGNDKALRKFVSDTLHDNCYIIEQNIKDIVHIMLVHITNFNNRENLKNILKYVFAKLVMHIKLDLECNDKSFSTKGRKCFVDTLSRDNEYIITRGFYFDSIKCKRTFSSDTEKTYQARNNEFRQSLQADNVARILFTNNFDESVLCHLCQILRSTEIMCNLKGQQSFFIDFAREIAGEQISNFVNKLKTRDIKSVDVTAADSFGFGTIEMYTTHKGANGGIEWNGYKIAPCTSETAENSIACCHVNTKSFVLPKNVVLTVESFRGSEDCSEQLRHLSCVTDNVDSLNVIKIENDHGNTLIYVAHDTTNATMKGMVSIFYDVHKRQSNANLSKFEETEVHSKILRYAPIRILNDVKRSVQRQQLTSSSELQIPNFMSIDGTDYIYTQLYIDKPWKSLRKFIDEYVAQLPDCQNRKLMCRITSRYKIGVYYHRKKYNPLSEVPTFAKELGNQREIFQILYAFVVESHLRTDVTEVQLELYLNNKESRIALFASYTDDNNIILNICEAADGKYTKSPFVHASRILTRILQYLRCYESLKIFEDVGDSFSHQVSFLVTIISDVYRKRSLSILSKKEIDTLAEKTKYIDMLCKQKISQNNQRKICQAGHSSCISRSCQIGLLDHFNESDIAKLIIKIFEEIDLALNSREIKITSIRINTDKKSLLSKVKDKCSVC